MLSEIFGKGNLMYHPQSLEEAFELLRRTPSVPKDQIDISALSKEEYAKWFVMTTTADEIVSAGPPMCVPIHPEWFRWVGCGEAPWVKGEGDGRTEEGGHQAGPGPVDGRK
jgi:hypothetical protein